MAMNVELETNNDFERQNEDATLNAKLKRRYDGYDAELETNDDSKRQNEYATLNIKLKRRWWL